MHILAQPARRSLLAGVAGGALALTALIAGSPALAEVKGAVTATSVSDIGQLSIEELANVEITSVAKRPQSLSDAASSVYVITREDIRRSGATSLPEVLRQAPNLDVAQNARNDYVISARGFNGVNTNNKLLVLIDGRTVYSPLHSQVFWDSQAVMLEDVERIEVISGPGGTLWGANAVNGVINIITRHSADTQGGLAAVAGGDQERDVSIRYGGKIGESATYRFYALGFDRDPTFGASGLSSDAWQGVQAGFRLDSQNGDDAYTLQGDAYRDAGETFYNRTTGYNLLGRWTRGFANGAIIQAQAYFDRAYRYSSLAQDRVNTYDLAAQYTAQPLGKHQIVAGAGYRYMQDRFLTTGPFYLDPSDTNVSLAHVFVQDDISLRPDLRLTLGMKLEHSSFTGAEYLPNLRIAWDLGRRGLLWAAASRSVRTPSTIDRNLTFDNFVQPARDFASESVAAFELGYRVQPTGKSTLSAAAYYNVYDNVRTLGLATAPGYAFKLANDLEGETYGLEAWADWAPAAWWRLSAGVNLLEKDLHVTPGRVDFSNLTYSGDDPASQAWLRSQMNPWPNIEMDVALRAVDRRSLTMTPGYVEADARLGWRLRRDLEVAVVGRNLLDAAHPEIGTSPLASEIRRSIYVTVRAGF